MPRTLNSERRRVALTVAASGAWIAVLALVYPFALEAALGRLGVRAVSLGLAAIAFASLLLRGPARGSRAIGAAGLLTLLLAAAVSEASVWLRLVPAWVYACLAGATAASLGGPRSMVERAARWLVPEAPDFIGSYCRVVTALWSALFFASAAAIGMLAVSGTPEAWRSFAGGWLWIAMAAVSAVEFLVRKTWFRYYARGGPFERLWSAWFPADRTARGRRSMAAIARWKERIAADSVGTPNRP